MKDKAWALVRMSSSAKAIVMEMSYGARWWFRAKKLVPLQAAIEKAFAHDDIPISEQALSFRWCWYSP